MNPTIKHTLTTFEDGAKYIDALAARDLLYHFEDDAADCLSAHNLSDQELEAISHNVGQLFSIDWKGHGYDCPFDYMITNHTDNED